MAWGMDVHGRAAHRVAREAVVDGPGVAVIGSAGLGKTALARAIGAKLDPQRFTASYVLATEAARSIPFGALAALLPAEPRAAGTAGTYHLIAAELQRRAGRGTPVLIVDDAHALDDPSAGVLPSLVTNKVARVMVTVQAAASAPDAVRALWKDQHLARLDLRPLDREGVRAALTDMVDGTVAESTVARLTYWSSGNLFYLRELVDFGLQSGHLGKVGSLWWWEQDLAVPPVLAELLERRLDGLHATERDVVSAVALGQPLPLDVVERLAPGVVEGLEDQELLRTVEEGDRICVRVAHPLLRSIVRRRISPARQTRIAAALLTTAETATRTADPSFAPMARAEWQPDFSATAEVEELLAAAEHRMCTHPEMARQLATAAWQRSKSTPVAIALAGALTECGDHEQARTVLHAAWETADTAQARLSAATELASHRCWVLRDPLGAAADLDALAATVTDRDAGLEVRSLRALVLLFGSRPAQALASADDVLAEAADIARAASDPFGAARGGSAVGPVRDASPAMRRATARAGLTRSCALTLVGRTGEAATVAAELAAETDRPVPGLPYLPGMVRASLALARLWRDPDPAAPATHFTSGRWPGNGRSRDPGSAAVPDSTPWALFDGYVRRVRGDRAGAIRLLQEALVQQSGGECLFRSEASAWLSICLAEDGQLGAARTLLAQTPPDRVALVPGLKPWADAALAVGSGEKPAASALLAEAADRAQHAGARLVEVGFLIQLAELRGPAAIADRLAAAVRQVDAPRLVAAAEATLALAHPDGGRLLDHVTRLTSAGLRRHALGVAEAAAVRLAHSDRRHHDAAAAARRLRSDLGLAAPGPVAGALTAREFEVAVLAAEGLSDRDIATRLFLSARTVESHLARVYRKLSIASRRHLRGALEASRDKP